MGIHEGPVTTSVRGEASDFAELATAKDPAATLINGALELQGDSAPLIELQKTLARWTWTGKHHWWTHWAMSPATRWRR